MDKPHLLGAVCTLLLTFIAQPVNAEFFSRYGGKVIYESDRNISWLANGNLAESNTFGVTGVDADGQMVWANNEPQNWLNAMNGASYLGKNNWRFPTTVHPDSTCSNIQPKYSAGVDCTGSEMGHLYYIGLDLVSGTEAGIGLGSVADIGPFKNVRSSTYWSGTPAHNDKQYSFGFNTGGQFTSDKNRGKYVWPVTDGDVFFTLRRCDLNDNGEVDAGDLLQVVRMTLGSVADDLDCDINNEGFGDGDVSTADLVIISRIVLGVIPEIHN